MKNNSGLSRKLIAVSTLLPLASVSLAADSPAIVSAGLQKPAWLTDLSFGVKESYDDNVLLVADKMPGLAAKSSWITTLSPKVGFNFASLLGRQKTWQTLSLVYSPDFVAYHGAPAESYNAHKIANTIKGKTGDFSFAADNAFLFNDAEDEASIYALDPAAANDKNRSAYSTAAARERRKQIQDRATIMLQYDFEKFFIRPNASLLFYNLMTDWHKSAGIYTGYQNYIDRADVNGGLDLGWKVTKDMAVTVGYRYGHQYQQALPNSVDTSTVNGQQMESSSDYQRVLLGLEGKPVKWLTVKLAGGPDFRAYDTAAPMDNYNPVAFYGEAALTATISDSQSLAFTYKQWQWVSSTGKVPYVDSTYALTYHWNATRQLGLDLGAKFCNSDYTFASPVKTSGSCLRDDAMYSLSAGLSYAFTPHFSAGLSYACDFGRNLQENAGPLASYREFDHQLVSLSAQFKF